MAEPRTNHIPPDIAVLTQIYGDQVNKKFKVSGTQIKIGRSPTCHIKVNSINVSRIHCTMTYRPDGWFIEDNCSQNGTYINGVQLEKNHSCILKYADIIFLGPPSSFPVAFSFDDTRDTLMQELYVMENLNSLTDEIEILGEKEKDPLCHPKHLVIEKKITSNNSNSVANTNVSKNPVLVPNTSNTVFSIKNAVSSTCANGSLKRKADVLKSAVPKSLNSMVTSKKLVADSENKKANERSEAKLKGKIKDNIQNQISNSEDCKDDSQSLLELDSNQFSEQIGSSDSTKENYSLNSNKSTEFKKPVESVEINDEHLKLTLAILSEKIKQLEKSKLDLLKEYEDVCQKNKILDQQLAEQKKLKEDMKMCELKIKNNFKSQIMENLEEDLVCNICTELLIKPTVLDCSHTFCEHCITEWKKKKKQCPICRNCIQSQTRVLALDHFIDRTLETLTPDQRERRKEVISQRERSKIEAAEARRNRRSVHGRRRRRQHRSTSGPSVMLSVPTDVAIIAEIVNQEPSIIVTGPDEYFLSDEDSIQGIYGPCYRCGNYGHFYFNCPL